MSLTENVLALHDGIAEAFILEEKSGHLVVLEEASRDRADALSNIIGESTENAALGPALILGAANQFSRTPNTLKLVGILYGDVGIILTYFGENKLLAISTETATFSATMQLVNDALPGLLKDLETPDLARGAVKSASDAGEIAHDYVAKAANSSNISVDEVNYRAVNHRWEVQGKYRTSFMSQGKNFHVELDGETGAIVSFRSSSSSSVLFGLELGALLAALGLVGWMLYVLSRR